MSKGVGPLGFKVALEGPRGSEVVLWAPCESKEVYRDPMFR